MAVDWRYSASQIDTYEMCERKWAWKYIDGVYTEPTAAAALGTEIHSRLEDWFGKKEVPADDKAGVVAQAMIPLLPAPHLATKKNIEREFQLKIEDLYFTGLIDLVIPGEVPTILDHKTTSDLRWAKTREGLSDDVQATLYAYWAFIHFKSPAVNLQWTYGVTRGTPHATIVDRVVTKREIEPRIIKSLQSAEEMDLIRRSDVQAIDVSYNASACEAFGGCPFKEKCNLNAKERMMAIMSQGQKKDFLSKLKERKKEKQQQAAPAEPEPEEVEEEKAEASPAPKNGKSTSLFGKMKKKKDEQVALNPPEEGTPAPPEPEKTKTKKTKAKTKAKTTEGWTLYIDCQPLKLPNEDDIVAINDAFDIIEALDESVDLEQLRQVLRDHPPKVGVVLNTWDSHQNHARAVFMQEAAVVISA